MRKSGLMVGAIFLLLFLVLSQGSFKSSVVKTDALQDVEDVEKEEEKPPKTTHVTVAAVGDIMMHDGQIKSGLDEKTGIYDYSEFFHVIKDEIL